MPPGCVWSTKEVQGGLNVGRVRGTVGRPSGALDEDDAAPRRRAEEWFAAGLDEVLAHAASLGVTVVLEPVNRYETDFLNRLEEAAAWMHRLPHPNFGLMPDVFHMNIEEVSVTAALVAHKEFVRYLHLADSNRLAPGRGHLPFSELFATLRAIGYRGWATLEILPLPDPDAAAAMGIAFLKPLLDPA
jgi:sugar phosphate isomerase/epimerase